MKASNKAYQLIRESEGLYLKAYYCPAGKLTIGYGHTGADVKVGMVIDKNKAEMLLKADVENCEKQINALGLRLTQGQFDALVDFVFNLGIGNLNSSTLLKKIRVNPNDPAIKDEFERWIYGGDGSHDGQDNDGDGFCDEPGEKLDLGGLKRRRAREVELYFE